MTQDEFNQAFGQGIAFGAVLAFLFTITAVWSLQLTPAEEIDRCRDLVESPAK